MTWRPLRSGQIGESLRAEARWQPSNLSNEVELQNRGKVFFWCGLAGILATGAIMGIGGGNYWALANVGRFSSTPSVRGLTLMFLMGVMVAGLDLIALGVVFAGAVLVIQRLRGRI